MFESWGDNLKNAYGAASDAARGVVSDAVKSAAAGADLVKSVSGAAKKAATNLVSQATDFGKNTVDSAVGVGLKALGVGKDVLNSASKIADVAKDKVVAVGKDVISGAVKAGTAAGSAIANVSDFAGRALVDAAGKGAFLFGKAVDGAVGVFSPSKAPKKAVITPCVTSPAAKKERMEQRAAAIKNGKSSGDPAKNKAAERLNQNNEAIEMARLSADSYAQFDPKNTDKKPPPGWAVLSDKELGEAGIDKKLLEDSKAVIYKTAPGWPGGEKTVLAFRGTADLADGVVDMDQALGVGTEQYKSSVQLGISVEAALGNKVIVTGHSLGGGKAQAAGIAGGLSGYGFNAAGPHTSSMGGGKAIPGQFQQYRAAYDPLTGFQNSPGLQALVIPILGGILTPLGFGAKIGDGLNKALNSKGLGEETAGYVDKAFKALPRSVGNLLQSGHPIPPAIGTIREVQSTGKDGDANAAYRPDLQHSIFGVINGIEAQKSEDMATLTGKPI